MGSSRAETITSRTPLLERLPIPRKLFNVMVGAVGFLTVLGIGAGILRPEINDGTVTLHPLWKPGASWQLPELEIPEIPPPPHGLILGQPPSVEAADTPNLPTATATTAPFTPAPTLTTGSEGITHTNTDAAEEGDSNAGQPAEQPDNQRAVDLVAGASEVQLATQDGMPVETDDVEAEPPPAASAEAAQLEQDIQTLQEVFQELAERYPEGYTGNLRTSGRMTMLGGLEGLGWAVFYNLQDLLRTFGPDLEVSLTRFFKEHPDAYLVVNFESERAVWCRQKYNQQSCRFTDGPVRVVVAIGYFHGQLTVREVYTSDAYTEQVASLTKEWAATSSILGDLPTVGVDSQPTDWRFDLGIAYPSGSLDEYTITPLTTFSGVNIQQVDIVYNSVTHKREPRTSGTVYIQKPLKEDFTDISEQLPALLQQVNNR